MQRGKADSNVSEAVGGDDFLYVFRRESDGYTKIGVTNDLMRRENEIANACGSNLRLVIACNLYDRIWSRVIENDWHKYLELMGRRSRGEWFVLPSPFLHELQAAIFLQYLDKTALIYRPTDKEALIEHSERCYVEYKATIEYSDDDEVVFYGAEEMQELKGYCLSSEFWLEEHDERTGKTWGSLPPWFSEAHYPVPMVLRKIEERKYSTHLKKAIWDIAKSRTGYTGKYSIL